MTGCLAMWTMLKLTNCLHAPSQTCGSVQLQMRMRSVPCTFPGSPSLYESDGEILVCTYIILIYCINVASFCGNLHHLPGIESFGVRGAWMSSPCSWPWLGVVHFPSDSLDLSLLTAAMPLLQLPARLQLNFAADVHTHARFRTAMNNLLATVETVRVKPTGLK